MQRYVHVLRTDVLGSQHGGVGRRLVTVGLDLHSTGDTGDGFAAGQIGDVDEGVVEGGEDAGNAENELALESAVNVCPGEQAGIVDEPRGPGVQAAKC